MSLPNILPKERGHFLVGLFLLLITLLLFLALVSDGYQGATQRPLSTLGEAYNLLGKPGALLAGVLYILLGHGAHVLYFLTTTWGLMLLRGNPLDRLPVRLTGSAILTSAVALLLHLGFYQGDVASLPGGITGAFAYSTLFPPFGSICTYVIASTLIVIGLLLSTDFLLLRTIKGVYDALVLVLSLGRYSAGFLCFRRSATDEQAQDIQQIPIEEAQKSAHRILGPLPTHVALTEETLLAPSVDLNEPEPLVFGREPLLESASGPSVFRSEFELQTDTLPERTLEDPSDPFTESSPVVFAPKRDVVRVRDENQFLESSAPTVPEEDLHSRIRVRIESPRSAPRVMQEEIPFDAVPDVGDHFEAEAEEEVESMPFALPAHGNTALKPTPPARTQETARGFKTPTNSAPRETASAEEKEGSSQELGAFLTGFDDEGETEDTVVTEADEIVDETVADETEDVESAENPIPVKLGPLAAAHAAKPAPARKAPSPRRKTAEVEEIPADYVYPRRYTRPPMDLLVPSPPSKSQDGLVERLRETAITLEKTLETFGIEARVMDVTRGPTITRFELEPAPGIKVSRFLSLADDLALALKSHGVRVEAPIPGKGRVGIEIPNEERDPVLLRELLESPDFKKTKGKLVLAMGKDIAGEVIATDLCAMPHLLVAGATGAGKTVCVKSFLASLLFTKTPEEVQLILIDPKMVELTSFNDIPHLITPVVIDPKKAAAALNWLIAEMEERYRLFSQLRVRNIEVYNESVENGEIEMSDADGVAGESVNLVRKLPYIVCVIDELADLMMLARAEVEDAIMRLAQLARAVGIHLVIATQRPSVNVLTGVIKANFPVRISFQVSSRTDSRCILDEIGAERLIGQGDMLYLPAGRSRPTRIQGSFVSDKEMNALVSYLKLQAPPQYRDEIENFGKSPEQMEDLVNETDELFEDAVRVVLETGQASISMVQRRLRVGYTRAARLIDMMELKGIVGPHLGSKAREILVEYAPAERDS